MTAAGLARVRTRLGWTQAQMAKAIGLTLRPYAEIEHGRATLRTLHRLALERVMLSEAAARAEPKLAPAGVRKDARVISG